jgi:hypothetical protein
LSRSAGSLRHYQLDAGKHWLSDAKRADELAADGALAGVALAAQPSHLREISGIDFMAPTPSAITNGVAMVEHKLPRAASWA